MEAVGELAPNQAPRLGRIPDAPFVPVPPRRTLHAVPPAGHFGVRPESDGGGCGDLARSLELLKRAGSTAVVDAAVLGFREAADFAADIEEISRTVEYLQLVAAGAVDRTRRQAASAARSGPGSGGSNGSGAAIGWVTGWGDKAAAHGPVGWVTGPGTETAAGNETQDSSGPAPDPADDGYRNAAEFLRGRLRISAPEARRRIALADVVLPRTGITGHPQPAERPELGAALAAGTIASRPATIITAALDRVRHYAPEDTTARMEHVLTRTAAEHDTDFLARVARRWTEAIDQDGSEPTEAELRHRQGAFLRPTRRGLHHVEIFATTDQCEHLLTVMNTATNPRTRPGATAGDGRNEDGCGTGDGHAGPGGMDAGEVSAAEDPDLRTRPQQLLDGLVGACKAALTIGGLPAAGGLRPQVMVTIDYRDLLDRLDHMEHATAQGRRYRSRAGGPGDGTDSGSGSATRIPGTPGTGSFTFTGPVPAATVRKIACDADIIPVLLGSQGRILDIGRTTRIFPPHIRKALTARDQGCAFPGCTIPAPWCEAHHITYWSHEGTTSTDNGTLLCSLCRRRHKEHYADVGVMPMSLSVA